MACALYAFPQDGFVRELSGEVGLRHAGDADFAPATVGSLVARDTVVSTGFRSSAVIEVGSATLIVRPLTRLSLAEISVVAGAESTSINLQAGRVRVDLRPPAGARAGFSVQGPSTVASVRGTSFEFDTRGITVLEGAVSLRGARGAPVMVRAGGESFVDANGRIADPLQNFFQALSPPAPVGVGVSGETMAATMPATTGMGVYFTIIYEQ